MSVSCYFFQSPDNSLHPFLQQEPGCERESAETHSQTEVLFTQVNAFFLLAITLPHLRKSCRTCIGVFAIVYFGIHGERAALLLALRCDWPGLWAAYADHRQSSPDQFQWAEPGGGITGGHSESLGEECPVATFAFFCFFLVSTSTYFRYAECSTNCITYSQA